MTTITTGTKPLIRTHSKMIALPTFEERYEYLRLGGKVGADTFGFDRYLNQIFYRSQKWKDSRDYVIIRDNGCDLAMPGHEIYGKIIVHHMNPLTIRDIEYETDNLLDPEYMVSTILNTHNAIHYGDRSLLITAPRERTPNDTCPWRH